MQTLCIPTEKTVLKPPLFLVIEGETNQFHSALAPGLASFRRVHEFNELRKVILAKRVVIVPGKVEGFRNAGATKNSEECFLDLCGCQWWAHGEVIRHYEAVIVLWKLW